MVQEHRNLGPPITDSATAIAFESDRVPVGGTVPAADERDIEALYKTPVEPGMGALPMTLKRPTEQLQSRVPSANSGRDGEPNLSPRFCQVH